METNSRPKRDWTAVAGGLILLATVIAWLGLLLFGCHIIDPEAIAARSTETALTAAHGAEAQRAIQAYLNVYWSWDAFHNPQLLSKVMVGQELQEMLKLRQGWSSDTVNVLKSSAIDNVQVIAYSPTQFKAFSCERLTLDSVTLAGTYVSSEQPRTFFRIYLFKLDSGVWKVAAWADFSDSDHIERDWTEGMYPKWEVDLIGDLPHFIDIYDSCFS